MGRLMEGVIGLQAWGKCKTKKPRVMFAPIVVFSRPALPRGSTTFRSAGAHVDLQPKWPVHFHHGLAQLGLQDTEVLIPHGVKPCSYAPPQNAHTWGGTSVFIP